MLTVLEGRTVHELREQLELQTGELNRVRMLYDGACETIRNQTDTIRSLQEKLTDYDALFDLQYKRMGEATEAWRAATGQHDVLPDLGDLLTWLLSERNSLTAERDELRKMLSESNVLGAESEAEVERLKGENRPDKPPPQRCDDYPLCTSCGRV